MADKDIQAQQLLDIIFTHGGDLLRDVQIFDVYEGDAIAANKKSLALSLILQHASRTLIDSEIDDVIQKILQQLKDELDLDLRE